MSIIQLWIDQVHDDDECFYGILLILCWIKYLNSLVPWCPQRAQHRLRSEHKFSVQGTELWYLMYKKLEALSRVRFSRLHSTIHLCVCIYMYVYTSSISVYVRIYTGIFTRQFPSRGSLWWPWCTPRMRARSSCWSACCGRWCSPHLPCDAHAVKMHACMHACMCFVHVLCFYIMWMLVFLCVSVHMYTLFLLTWRVRLRSLM